MKILLDMDGVVVDFLGPLLKQYNFLTNENIKRQDVTHMKTSKCVGDPYTLNKLINSVGFIRNLPPIDGAIDGVKTLIRQGHEVVFVSNGTRCPTSGHEKRDWLNYYFSAEWKIAPLVLTYFKYHVRGDCLVDDNPKNFNNLDPSTVPLLWHHPYNTDITKYQKIYDWSNLLDWVSRQ